MQEQFVRQLRKVRTHGDRFHRRLASVDDPVVVEALAELSTALEELRVTEEQLRSDGTYLNAVEGERERYRALFEEAPSAYLVTDREGLVRQANLRASSLLGVDRQWLAGKPLASFVQLADRRAFRQLLLRPDRLEGVELDLRLQPRHGFGVRVRALAGSLRDPSGAGTALAWLLRELPASASGLAGLLAPGGSRLADGGSGRPDWEALSAALQGVAESVVTVLGTDGAGLMLADGRALGTCNAISRAPRRWSAADVSAMNAFAAVLGRLLAQAAEASQQAELVAQLRRALESRIAIEQAKGVLMARLSVDEQAAFERLRQIARSSSRKITDVAGEVVAGRLHVAAPRRSGDRQGHWPG